MIGRSEVERARLLLGGAGAELKRLPGPTQSRLAKESQSSFELFPLGLFHYAGYGERERQRYYRVLALGGLAACGGALLLGTPVPFVIPFLVYVLQRQLLEMRKQVRQSNFDRDYAALLLSLSSGLRTGLDPLVALARSSNLFDQHSVIREELLAFERALAEGASEDQALDAFGATVSHPDLPLFRMAFRLARKEGSSLSLCLQRLARVTRQRQSFRRRVKGAVAMQKLSAFGIALCAVFIGVVQAGGNSKALLDAYAHPLGRALLFTSAALIIAGIFWMLRMSKMRVA